MFTADAALEAVIPAVAAQAVVAPVCQTKRILVVAAAVPADIKPAFSQEFQMPSST